MVEDRKNKCRQVQRDLHVTSPRRAESVPSHIRIQIFKVMLQKIQINFAIRQ